MSGALILKVGRHQNRRESGIISDGVATLTTRVETKGSL